ncbi:MAG TPA: chromate resistance protein ChrB domain-containing protein [Steroidobacteraceae bacterium]|jgi:hypothetical protein|nr:chromate resistance protein ChrB domain-containing protein [Steroidobacteraceae bacterium]
MDSSSGASKPQPWLLFVTNLPGRNQTVRMRLWRSLKAAGAGLLRDGVYVLPDNPSAQELLGNHASEIGAAGGAAHVLMLSSSSEDQECTLRALFDRTEEYAELEKKITSLRKGLPKLIETDARQQCSALRAEFDTLAALDFFPGSAQRQMQGALQDMESQLNTRFSPDEPRSSRREIPLRNRKDFQGRTWATRERMWIDRVASAWLIRRHIDHKAKFIWLKKPKDCPKSALGFDFDEATFTHIDSKVTFEVLLASFGLEQDPGLMRLGALVHFLDVGGIPVPEAAGFASIMTGARASQPDDSALLELMLPVLDSLYRAFVEPG